MTYGFKYEEIEKINHPEKVGKAWGYYVDVVRRPEYSLTKICLKEGGIQPLHYSLTTEGAFFVEEGALLLKLKSKKGKLYFIRLNKGDIFRLKPGLTHAFCGLEKSHVYLFSNKCKTDDEYDVETEEEVSKQKLELDGIKISDSGDEFKIEKPFDYRDKYWGSIQSVVSEEYSGKRIYLKAGAQNSLEFHCNKVETYFVHSGKLKVGVRIGRGENKSIVMGAGDAFEILPGLMHMKIGIEDSVIMEISTHDEDSDSHLVEDGKKYVHAEK